MSVEIADARDRQAALDPTQSFVVRAPAGSGKTGLLTQRMLTLLAHVDRPEAVLAITFTRKAAAEMRARVLGALQDAGEGKTAANGFEAQTLERARKALDHGRSLGWDLLREPARLRISTIDALSGSLINRARASATVTVLLPTDERLADAYLAAARSAVLEATQASPGEPEYRALRDALPACSNRPEALAAQLADMLAQRSRWVRLRQQLDEGKGSDDEWRRVVETELARGPSALAAVDLDLLFSLMRYAVSNFNAGTAKTLDPVREAIQGRQERPGFNDLSYWKGCAALLLSGDKVRKPDGPNKKSGFPKDGEGTEPDRAKERKAAMGELLMDVAACGTAVPWLNRVRKLPDPASDQIAENTELVRSLVVLLKSAEVALLGEFAERGVMDFTQAQVGALEALGTEGGPTELALSEDMRIQHLLVDEVQDTSISQYDLFRRLTEGWTEGDGHTLFLVGDPMQSIYRFREAEPREFERIIKKESFGNLRLTLLSLTANFRSDPVLVAWWNQHRELFEAESGDTPGVEPGPRWTEAQAANEPCGEAGVVLHPVFEEDDPQAEAQRVVALVQQELAASEDSSIAILGRTRSVLAPISKLLDQQQIPWQGRDLQALWDRQVVRDVASLVRVLAQPADAVAWLALLRSPLCGLDLKTLSALVPFRTSRAKPFDPMPELLKVVQADPSLAGAFDESSRRRVQTLWKALAHPLAMRGREPLGRRLRRVTRALAMDKLYRNAQDRAFLERTLALVDEGRIDERTLTPASLRAELEEAYFSAAAPARVELMTIHKSKGLEFDVVVVPGLCKQPGGNMESPPLRMHEVTFSDEPPALLVGAKTRTGSKSELYTLLADIAKAEEALEGHRQLYVALTRAKTRLHLVAKVKPELHEKNPAAALAVPHKGSLLGRSWDSIGHEFWAEIPAGTYDGLFKVKGGISLDPIAVEAGLPAEGQGVNGFDATQLVRRTMPALEALALHDEDSPPQAISEQRPEFEWAKPTRRLIGTLLHAHLEHFPGMPTEAAAVAAEIERRLARLERELVFAGVPTAMLPGARRDLEFMLRSFAEDEHGLWLFHPSHGHVRNEWALTVRETDEQGRTFVGNRKIDRSFVADGVRWIVDYKTSVHGGGDLEAFLVEERTRYEPQLARYARAVAALEDRPIKVALYFPMHRRLVAWDPA